MKTIILILFLSLKVFAQWQLPILFDSETTTPPSGSGSFRNAVLLTHSSGARLYDYETYMDVDSGDITSVPLEIDAYNTANDYTGDDEIEMAMRWFPVPDGTDWSNWYLAFTDDLAGNDLYAKLDTFNVIAFKGGIQTCNMTGYGSASDTAEENRAVHIVDKTVIMYKWIWRVLIDSMAAHPETFWVIMTGSASGDENNTPTGAQLAHEFATWAKDTLATGIDAYGDFPNNIYVFDYFHYLADNEHYLKDAYESGYQGEDQDDHPNATACDVIAPIFVDEIFDAAKVYENIYNPPPAGTEQAETTRFLAALGTPLNEHTETAIDSFVVMLKDTFNLDSLSQMFNAIYLHAIETEEASKLNLVKRTHDITEVNADLIWTQNEGWAGDYDGGNVEGTGYLDCNYNFATDSNSIAGRLNIGITTYVRQADITDVPWDAQSLYFVNDGNGNVTGLSARRNDDAVLYKLNDDTFNGTLSNSSGQVGVYTLNRIGSTRTLYKNSASFFSETVAATELPNAELWLLRNNNSGTVAGRSSPKQISITMVHRGLTTLTEHQSLRNILEWWMDRWGKGVL